MVESNQLKVFFTLCVLEINEATIVGCANSWFPEVRFKRS